VPRLVVALVLGGLLIGSGELDKRHYAAHRLSGRIFGGVFDWLLFAFSIWLILAAAGWVLRRLTPGDTRRVRGGSVGLGFALTIATAVTVHSALNRHHYASSRLSVRIDGAIFAWLALVFVIWLVLRLLVWLGGRVRARRRHAHGARLHNGDVHP
jgi:hypothetical protein